MSANRCRYCWAEIPDFEDPDIPVRMEVQYRTRADILASSDLWAREETIENITNVSTGPFSLRLYSDESLIPVRIRVDPRKPLYWCSELHRKAMAGNKAAAREAVGEFRDDEDDTPEPVMIHPDQARLEW
jgi:hypothetical protein